MSGSGRVYHELTVWSRGIIMDREASIQIQAGRNRPDRGMDVPAELREGENPAKHLGLRKETDSMPLNRGVGD
jgi:hypothetical protein